jgi:hypothetical protein
MASQIPIPARSFFRIIQSSVFDLSTLKEFNFSRQLTTLSPGFHHRSSRLEINSWMSCCVFFELAFTCSRPSRFEFEPLQKAIIATKKKASHFRLGLLLSRLFLDWCGGGDLNPYALRR